MAMINRTIHQTWKDAHVPGDVYPHVWQQSWKDRHPDWQYRLWTDEDNRDLIRRFYPQFLEGYDSLGSGVMKSDVARALILHAHGGLYADLDFVCLRSFAPLVDAVGQHIVVGRHANDRQPRPNALMYAPVGHPFWMHLVADALFDWRRGNHTKTEQVAGPDRLDWCLSKYNPDRVELPPDVAYPFTWGNDTQTEKARRLNWGDLNELEQAYAPALAVTRWCHNW